MGSKKKDLCEMPKEEKYIFIVQYSNRKFGI